MSKKIISTILTLIFLSMAAVQYNDPDPLLWMAIYGYVAMISAFAIFEKYNVQLIAVGWLVCLGGSLYLMQSVFEWLLKHRLADIMREMSPDQPYIEESRECLGLMISLSVLTYYYFMAKGARKTTTKNKP